MGQGIPFCSIDIVTRPFLSHRHYSRHLSGTTSDTILSNFYPVKKTIRPFLTSSHAPLCWFHPIARPLPAACRSPSSSNGKRHLSRSVAPSLSLAASRSLSLPLALSHSVYLSLCLSLTRSLSLAPSLPRSLSLTLSLSRSLSLALYLSLSLSLSHSLSLSAATVRMDGRISRIKGRTHRIDGRPFRRNRCGKSTR